MSSHFGFIFFLLMLVIGCGGDKDAPASSPELTEQTTKAALVESTYSDATVIDLTGQVGEQNKYKKAVKGNPEPTRAVVDDSFANAMGELTYIRSEMSASEMDVRGNLTLGVRASDIDGLSKVSLYVPEVEHAFTLCDMDCPADFFKTLTGLNPELINLSEGRLTLHLIVEDALGNNTLVSQLSLNWQPLKIFDVNTHRENGVVSVYWADNPSIKRYNLYAATENDLTPTNALSLENGIQLLALNGTSAEFVDADSAKDYYILLTGIDNNGESGGTREVLPLIPVDPEQLPITQTDRVVTDEDQPLIINVLVNDQGKSLKVDHVISLDTVGKVNFSDDGEITYIPAENFNGEDTFSYQVIDIDGAMSIGHVFINVQAVNDMPAVGNDSFSIVEDAEIKEVVAYTFSLFENGNTIVNSAELVLENETNEADNPNFNLLDNDNDLDGDKLSIVTTPVEAPKQGSLVLNNDGSFIYQADGPLNVDDYFVYQVIDNKGGTAQGRVNILAAQTTTEPIAKNDIYQVGANNTLKIDKVSEGLLANDTSSNDLILEIDELVLIQPLHGELSIALNGTFSYTPDQNFFGIDQIKYQVKNSLGGTSTAFLIIKVNNLTDAFLAIEDNYQIEEGETLVLSKLQGLLANDINSKNHVIGVNIDPVITPQNGTVILQGNGSFSYTPNANFSGTDSFTYQLINGDQLTSTALVNIVINPKKAVQEVISQSLDFDEDTEIAGSLFAEIDGIENDSLTINPIPVIPPQNGDVILNQEGGFSYTPKANFNGLDTFTYEISDRDGNRIQAEISLNVLPKSDEPIAIDDNYSVSEDGHLIVLITDDNHLLVNDSDADGDSLSINTTPSVNATNGVLTLNSDGSFNYSPNENFSGQDSFTYEISDSNGGSSQANVAISVDRINDAPLASDQSFTLGEHVTNGHIVGTTLATDTEGDTLSFSISGGEVDLFDIDPVTGVLSIKGTMPLDYETNIQNFVKVSITDNGMPKNETTEITITVNITNVGEEGYLNEVQTFGRPVIGDLELTGSKAEAKLVDSVIIGSTLFSIGQVDNFDKDIQVIAYNENGLIEPSFANAGIASFDFGQDEYAQSIVALDNRLYMVFVSDNGVSTKICFMALDVSGSIDNSFGSDGIRCTAENRQLVIKDLATNSRDLFAVGYVDSLANDDTDLLVIQLNLAGDFIDHTPLDSTDSPHIIQDVSGVNQDDKGFALYSPNGSDLLISGTVASSRGDSDIFAWLIDENAIGARFFNNGNAQVYDVDNTNDQVFAVGGMIEADFNAFLVGSTELANGDEQALIIAIDSTSELITGFSGTGIQTYPVSNGVGDNGESIDAPASFSAIAVKDDALYLAGTLFDGFKYLPFTNKVFSANGTLDQSNYGDAEGILKINTTTSNHFALSMSLGSNNIQWLTGVEQANNTSNMVVTAVNQVGQLCNDGCQNDFESGQQIIAHSSEESDDSAVQLLHLQNAPNRSKFLLASIANDGDNDQVILTRFTNEGLLDTSFHTDGHKRVKIGTNASVSGLLELVDGKIIIFGNVIEDVGSYGFIAQLDNMGNLDLTFANNGVFTTEALGGTKALINQARVDSLGNIVAVGSYENTTTNAFVLRVLANGTLDSSFNTTGYVISAVNDDYMDLLIDSNNNVFAGGSRLVSNKAMLVVKYTNSGAIDLSFNGTGQQTFDIDLNADDSVKRLKFDDSQSSLYWLGNAVNASLPIVVVKTSVIGAIDPSFSTDGIARFMMSSSFDGSGINDVVIDNKNNIVVAGFSLTSSIKTNMIGRITFDGALDPLINGNGYFEGSTCANDAQISSIILTNNSTFIVAGQCFIDGRVKGNIELSKYQIN